MRRVAEVFQPERSNPLPETKRAFAKYVLIPTVLAQSYFGYRRGIASLRKSNFASLHLIFSARNDGLGKVFLKTLKTAH
jgi:hypothetical protein